MFSVSIATLMLSACGPSPVEVGQTFKTRTLTGTEISARVMSCSPSLLVLELENPSSSPVDLRISMGDYDKEAGTMFANWKLAAPAGTNTVKLDWNNAESDYGDFGDKLACSNLSVFTSSTN